MEHTRHFFACHVHCLECVETLKNSLFCFTIRLHSAHKMFVKSEIKKCNIKNKLLNVSLVHFEVWSAVGANWNLKKGLDACAAIRESCVARLSQTRDQASLSLSRVYAIAPSFILLRSGLPFPAQPPTVPYHTPLQLVVICLPVCLLYRLSQLCVPGQFRHACFCFFFHRQHFLKKEILKSNNKKILPVN